MSPRRVPAEIYWRRRLLVLAVIILLAWGGIQIFGGDKADKPVAKAKPTATTVAPTVAPPVNGKFTVNLATGTATCEPGKVLVSPAVKPGQFTGGEVDVTMSVSTTQSEPCILNAKTAKLLVVISANKAPVWDSDVCKTALLTSPVAISPKWATVVETTWSGRGSGPKCSPKEGFASPGTYVIKSATLGGEIGQATFHIANKPKPKPTEPTDNKSDKKSG
ncbi:MAG: hypothetical protein ABIR57_12810 [Aeromicrobium sp.]